MIMRITWGKIRPGMWDKFEKLWNDFAAETEDTEGLLGRWLARDNDQQDAGYSLTLWSSAEALKAYEAERPIYEKMKECFVGQFVTTNCDVNGMHLKGLRSIIDQTSKS